MLNKDLTFHKKNMLKWIELNPLKQDNYSDFFITRQKLVLISIENF